MISVGQIRGAVVDHFPESELRRIIDSCAVGGFELREDAVEQLRSLVDNRLQCAMASDLSSLESLDDTEFTGVAHMLQEVIIEEAQKVGSSTIEVVHIQAAFGNLTSEFWPFKVKR